MTKNTFEQVLIDAQAEREKRQARRREEIAKYNPPMPKFTPELGVKPPLEVRERLRRKIKELLSD